MRLTPRRCLVVLNPLLQVHRLGGHPNVTAMLGFVPEGKNGGVPLLALELCEEGDLKAYLRKKGALPMEDLMPMCRDVAAAMAFLETSLIVHRDLAARNVLLTQGKISAAAAAPFWPELPS